MPNESSSSGSVRSIKVRYLAERPRKGGSAWYWVPTRKLLGAGFAVRRLSDDQVEAIKQAEQLNADLDRWYREGTAPTARIRGDSLQALYELFQTDDGFKGMGTRTQRDFLYSIKPALAWGGDMPASALTRKAIKAWVRDQQATKGASTARNAAAALRRLLSFAVDDGWIPVNPALKMRLQTPESRARVWTEDERRTFCATALDAGRPSMALAVTLGWCLGQRPADLRRLSWKAYDGQAVALRQGKTGTDIWVPCLPDLKRLLDDQKRVSTQIVVSENTGRPYQESDFQHTFAELRDKAGLPGDLQFRDLRRTLATALGAAGCTDDQIRSVTGHKTRSVVAVYVRPDRTFAEGAMRRLQRSQKAR